MNTFKPAVVYFFTPLRGGVPLGDNPYTVDRAARERTGCGTAGDAVHANGHRLYSELDESTFVSWRSASEKNPHLADHERSVLAADLVVGITLRGMSPGEVFFHRDPISGTAYYLSLLLFAGIPWLLARHRHSQRGAVIRWTTAPVSSSPHGWFTTSAALCPPEAAINNPRSS